MLHEIEIKSSKSFSILPAIGLTALIIFFINDQRGKLFNWTDFNPNGINTIIFLMFLSLTVFSWLLFFDNKPIYKIAKEGIWYRKNLMTKKLNCLAPWNKMEYFFIQALTDKIYTEEIIVKLNDREKFFKMGLTGLSVPKDVILKNFIEKSKEFNFHDLGLESNRYSKYK